MTESGETTGRKRGRIWASMLPRLSMIRTDAAEREEHAEQESQTERDGRGGRDRT
jgi:hypothetical protein